MDRTDLINTINDLLLRGRTEQALRIAGRWDRKYPSVAARARAAVETMQPVKVEALYTVEWTEGEWAGEHLTLQVRRQPEDDSFMPGKLLVGFLTGPDHTFGSKDYKNCGVVTSDGRVVLWERYRGAEATRLQAAIRVLVGNPVACAGAFGTLSGKCAVCGRTLTASAKHGIGPKCRKRFS
jgi:hypothetical protein